MTRAGSELPQDIGEAIIAAGGAALRQAIPILTKAQAEKLFRTAHMDAEQAGARARRIWDEWLDDQVRRNTAEEVRRAEEAERRRAEEAERARRAAAPPQSGLPHRILGVSADAGRAEINRAWRRLAAEFHPDTPGGDGAAMAAINAARDQMLRRPGIAP